MNSGCSVCTLAPLVPRRYPWVNYFAALSLGVASKGDCITYGLCYEDHTQTESLSTLQCSLI